MDNPLKPCPFCGSEKARIVWSPGPEIRITGIFCYECKAAVIWPFKDTLVGKETVGQMQQPWIEMYNRRAGEAES